MLLTGPVFVKVLLDTIEVLTALVALMQPLDLLLSSVDLLLKSHILASELPLLISKSVEVHFEFLCASIGLPQLLCPKILLASVLFALSLGARETTVKGVGQLELGPLVLWTTLVGEDLLDLGGVLVLCGLQGLLEFLAHFVVLLHQLGDSGVLLLSHKPEVVALVLGLSQTLRKVSSL